MNNRRKMLLGDGGDKGLPIYKKGATDWLNVEEATLNRSSMTVTFNSDNVAVTSGGSGYNYYVLLKISQSVYGKYSKLVFTAIASSVSSATSITWTTSQPASGAPPSGEQAMLTTTLQEYSIDISGESGDRYIQILPHGKDYTITIYDMHFE